MKTLFGGEGRAFIIRTELESMIDDSLLKAEIDRDDIESGVVILTGTRYGGRTLNKSPTCWPRSRVSLFDQCR